jgi:hypothetical protein
VGEKKIVAVHTNSAVWMRWVDRSVLVPLEQFGRSPGTFEEILAKNMGGAKLKICCIPFFTYGVSLGDIVEVDANGKIKVVEQGGRAVVRFLVDPRVDVEEMHCLLHDWVETIGRDYEWHAAGYLAVDVEKPDAVPNWNIVEKLIQAGGVYAEVG